MIIRIPSSASITVNSIEHEMPFDKDTAGILSYEFLVELSGLHHVNQVLVDNGLGFIEIAPHHIALVVDGANVLVK